MGFWRFADQQSLQGLAQLVPGYDYTMGWVAGLLAVLAGFALFPTLARVRSARAATPRRAWQLGGAITMGIGFWGCQNMALVGFQLPTFYIYEPLPGMLALLPVVAGCAVAIQVLASPLRSSARLHLGAVSLALGVAVMHYTLMEAIQGDLILVYDPVVFAESLVLGYGFALLALFVNRAMDQPGPYRLVRWILGSFVLGITVIGNHFAAMGAARFYDDPSVLSSEISVPPAVTMALIGGCVLFLVAAYWLGTVIDARLSEAGDALRNSEARNRAVIETMLDGHLITDYNGKIKSFNPAAEQIFGWSAAEVIGRSVQTLVSEASARPTASWPERGARTLALPASRRRWVYAEGGLRKDGSRFPVELAINPFEVAGNQYFSAVIRDLSDHWQAEAKLHRLAAAIEQAGDAIAILDAEHRIQYVNPQYERQTGLAADQIVGKIPASGASESDVYAEIWDTVGQGRKWTGQVRSRRGNGDYCEEELTVAPVCDSRGKVTAYVAVMRDVTRRLEGELERRRLAEALQHCTDSIEILDAQGRIVYVNAAFETSTGQRLVEIRGSRPEALSDFTMAEASYQDMLRTAYRGGRPWSGTLKSLSLSGDLREEDVTVSPMRDDSGTLTGYVVVKRDTTDRRRLEAQTQQKQKLESIGQLADGIASELSRPMQQLADHVRFLRDSFVHLDQLLVDLASLVERREAIPAAVLGGVMQSADVDFLRREISDALDHSGGGVQQMTEIVNAMRAISYSGRERTMVDLNRTIQSTITISSSEWRSVAEIRSDFDPYLPPVRCAPGDVSLVLLNLLVNSAQSIAASNPSGIRGKGIITVSTRWLDKWAEIRVERSGNTVSPEQRQQLFDPAAAGVSADPVMALAHDIIATRHGGSIALEAEPGRSTAFILRLPIAGEATTSSTAAA